MNSKAKFVKIAETGRWGILVSGAAPQVGSEYRVRKADGTVTTVVVARMVTSHSGGTVCQIVDQRTESVSSQRLTNDIYPATHPRDAAASRSLERVHMEREGRDSQERRNQVGL